MAPRITIGMKLSLTYTYPIGNTVESFTDIVTVVYGGDDQYRYINHDVDLRTPHGVITMPRSALRKHLRSIGWTAESHTVGEAASREYLRSR